MTLIPYIRLVRPHQCVKNLILFFPPFLGGVLFKPGVLALGFLPFVSFTSASSATYILNDILDSRSDANHPQKKLRPIPSGEVSPLTAWGMSGFFLTLSLFLAWKVSFAFLLILSLYIVISTAYSLALKHYPLLDIFCIAAGFLLRLLAGGAAFSVVISDWLFLSVFLLALFLGTGKRLSEKNMLGDKAESHRKALLAYPRGFLEGVMYLTGGSVLVTYTMYVITRHSMVYTVPLCCFGLLRYMLRVHQGLGGDPTDALLKDIPLFSVGLIWTIMVGWAIYGR